MPFDQVAISSGDRMLGFGSCGKVPAHAVEHETLDLGGRHTLKDGAMFSDYVRAAPAPSRLLKKGHLKREFRVFEARHLLRASSDGALCERFDLIFHVYGSLLQSGVGHNIVINTRYRCAREGREGGMTARGR
jgi:hypothetical protein